jgi:uncharacterized iron-regulated protein
MPDDEVHHRSGHGHGKAMPDDEVHHPEVADSRGMPDDAIHNPEGHPGEADFIDKIYPVQVLWDETMADTAARWLQGDPNRRIIILAGNGHCHDSAIVARMKRRGIDKVVSVRPIVDTGDGAIGDLLAEPRNDYLFVMSNPESDDAGAKSSGDESVAAAQSE